MMKMYKSLQHSSRQMKSKLRPDTASCGRAELPVLMHMWSGGIRRGLAKKSIKP